ncbi:LuxR C-terminal-related transcriptional regulator [Enterobacterales bacterium AE_CKDN230030158-1A_HGKHYDSX7]
MLTANSHSAAYAAPALPSGFLPRPRLSTSLLAASARLRLICAPAGSGKSVLLRECAQACPEGTRLVWLDLRGVLADELELRQRLAQALQLESADSGVLLGWLAKQRAPLWIMLDDLSSHCGPQLDGILDQLLQASSPAVRWWLASRRRPACKLERLLLEGDLYEVGAGELALNTGELGELLGNLYGEAPAETVEALLAETDGWFAGVRLRLHGRDLAQTRETAPGNALIRRYLEREVLAELSDELRETLCRLSCLQDFDASLCEHVLGVGEGAALLRRLLEAGVFIETLDDEASLYRVQPAVAPLLSSEVSPALKRAQFRHACQWAAGRGQVRQAIDYALQAEQPDVAASLIQHFTKDRLLQGSQLARVLQWRNELPAELLSSTPRLLILNTWALLISGRLDDAEISAAQLQRFLPQPTAKRQRHLLAQCQALLGKLEYHRGTVGAPHMVEALLDLPEAAWAQHVMLLSALIELEIVDGRIDTAQTFHRDAIKLARRFGSRVLEALLLLQQVQLMEMRGELGEALRLVEQLHQELDLLWKGEANPLRGRTRLRLAAILTRLGRRVQAREHFEAGLQECLDCADPAACWGYIGLAELDAMEGALPQSHLRLADAERLLQFRNITEPLYQSLLTLSYARLWIQDGQVSRARAVLDACLSQYTGPERHRPPYGNPELVQRLQLAQAHARLADGEDVAATFDAMLQAALKDGRRALAVELWFGLAEAYYAKGQQSQAQKALLDAMALSRQLGTAGAEYCCSQRNPGLIRWGKETLNADSPSSAAVLLSRRELAVLGMIAQGLSNQDIAEQLYISLHTVKSHAQSINTKLGVARRTQAIVRAKELGLVK